MGKAGQEEVGAKQDVISGKSPKSRGTLDCKLSQLESEAGLSLSPFQQPIIGQLPDTLATCESWLVTVSSRLRAVKNTGSEGVGTQRGLAEHQHYL